MSNYETMFCPKESVNYEIIPEEEESFFITFTEDNDIKADEDLIEHTAYEAFDETEKRYVLYVDEYMHITIHTKNADGKLIRMKIYQIYNGDERVYSA